MSLAYTITPLGAAIVEALPDRKKVQKIKRKFKRLGVIPTSQIFKTQNEIEEFYRIRLRQNTPTTT